MIATIRINSGLLLLLLTIAVHSSKAFGVTKSLLSRNVSPKVQFVKVMSSGTSAIQAATESSKRSTRPAPKDRLLAGLNRPHKLRNVLNQIPKISATKISRRGLLLGLASLLVNLVWRPTVAIAMGGGMGGSKGPVAPMPR
jgi:hypothetical protein